MFIPQGDWIVVRRAVRGENHLRGEIVKGGLTEAQAKAWAKAHVCPGFDYWAMHKSSY